MTEQKATAEEQALQTESSQAENAPIESSQPVEQKSNKIRKATNIILIIVSFLFVFHLIADRFIPSTDLGRIRGYVVPISPQVSGEIIEILATPNTFIKAGDVLAKIDTTDYEIALEQAEQSLKKAGQNVGAQTANVAAAQAKVTNAQANYTNAKVQSKRIFTMVEKQVMSQADADNARAELTKAEAGVASAKADLAKAKERLGAEGENNTNVKSALLSLEKAQLNLQRTSITAPTDGVASNFRLKEGIYANAGQPIMTFISSEDVWIEAYFRENSLGNISAGDEVEFALDYAPGEVFKATVGSIDYGIDWGQSEETGKLAQISGQTGWLRQSQRFPVTIVLSKEEAVGLRRVGGQADVIVYTKDNSLINLFGRAWIRVSSWFSYVR
ncbi:HlyD family secretion protein [Shewanella sp. Choline-02u-19]|uniref:HlyD family secretion protein n=1 Tax=unclassified Shewanella TaxID=196818 RepID=UPI000C32D1FD|nr:MULTISPECIES: HlyD family secretion protein [unclassified Shewanella]PKG58672.1 HlyD family secretion protein [Shewanella sp. GutDb-MelDb]PKG76285.1 HlyD family secretion protein [Shewanella sp. GutCb]PKH57434.1 HlyD family secretion protein [Shewanella sp. Bg11-22]PKI28265.1 HlyD family secretion protein [Shewanella sp. Choline-02u-19]